jgi:hypothetical protein
MAKFLSKTASMQPLGASSAYTRAPSIDLRHARMQFSMTPRKPTSRPPCRQNNSSKEFRTAMSFSGGRLHVPVNTCKSPSRI